MHTLIKKRPSLFFMCPQLSEKVQEATFSAFGKRSEHQPAVCLSLHHTPSPRPSSGELLRCSTKEHAHSYHHFPPDVCTCRLLFCIRQQERQLCLFHGGGTEAQKMSACLHFLVLCLAEVSGKGTGNPTHGLPGLSFNAILRWSSVFAHQPWEAITP